MVQSEFIMKLLMNETYMKEHFPSDLEMAGAALIGVNRGDRETHTIVLGR